MLIRQLRPFLIMSRIGIVINRLGFINPKKLHRRLQCRSQNTNVGQRLLTHWRTVKRYQNPVVHATPSFIDIGEAVSVPALILSQYRAIYARMFPPSHYTPNLASNLGRSLCRLTLTMKVKKYFRFFPQRDRKSAYLN